MVKICLFGVIFYGSHAVEWGAPWYANAVVLYVFTGFMCGLLRWNGAPCRCFLVCVNGVVVTGSLNTGPLRRDSPPCYRQQADRYISFFAALLRWSQPPESREVQKKTKTEQHRSPNEKIPCPISVFERRCAEPTKTVTDGNKTSIDEKERLEPTPPTAERMQHPHVVICFPPGMQPMQTRPRS